MGADSNHTWRESLQQGGAIAIQNEQAEALIDTAKSMGFAVFQAECKRAKSKSAVLRAIANAVDYPEYFGSDLDALLDCLTGTALDQNKGALMVLRGLNYDEPGLASHLPEILEVFQDAAREVRDGDRILAYICVASLPDED